MSLLIFLPLGMFNTSPERETIFNRGFPVGFHTGKTKKGSKHYLYNHIRIIIQYHDDKDTGMGSEATSTKVSEWRVFVAEELVVVTVNL